MIEFGAWLHSQDNAALTQRVQTLERDTTALRVRLQDTMRVDLLQASDQSAAHGASNRAGSGSHALGLLNGFDGRYT
jgi:hypothetical protein